MLWVQVHLVDELLTDNFVWKVRNQGVSAQNSINHTQQGSSPGVWQVCMQLWQLPFAGSVACS